MKHCEVCGHEVVYGPLCLHCEVARVELPEAEWPAYVDYIRAAEVAGELYHPNRAPYELTAKGWAAVNAGAPVLAVGR